MTELLPLLVRWPRLLAVWLLQARLLAFSVLVVVVAAVVPIYWIQTEPSVRLAGLCLELVGLLAATLGIRDTRRMFGKPSFLALARSWLKRIPPLKPKVISATGSATGSLSMTGRAHVWHAPKGENPSIEARLAAAEANLKGLYERFSTSEASIEQDIRLLRQQLKSEEIARVEANRQLHIEVESAATDGLHLAAAGVVWLAVGLILSTAPSELLAWLS